MDILSRTLLSPGRAMPRSRRGGEFEKRVWEQTLSPLFLGVDICSLAEQRSPDVGEAARRGYACAPRPLAQLHPPWILGWRRGVPLAGRRDHEGGRVSRGMRRSPRASCGARRVPGGRARVRRGENCECDALKGEAREPEVCLREKLPYAGAGGGGLDGTADVGRREVSTPSLPGAWACDNVRACAEKIVGNATGCASSLLLAGPLGLPPRVKAMRVRTMLSAVRCAAPRRQGHRGGADLCVFAQPTRNPTPHVPPGVRRARRVQPVQ